MKKPKFGSIEALGIAGMAIWTAVILLRKLNLSENAFYIFTLGILPNLGAAWAMTMFGKWAIELVLRRKYTLQKHLVLCLVIIVLAMGSESIHDSFLNSPYDRYDILLTTVAQLIMLSLPIALKDKAFAAD